MGATIIDGKALAEQAHRDLAARVELIRSKGRPVRLDAVLVDSGDNGARIYAENQARTCQQLGIDYELHVLEANSSLADINRKISALSLDPQVHAIMMHMPVPAGIDPYEIQVRIAPEKDVEGVNPANIGNVVYGRSLWAPCTALSALRLIESTGFDLRGKRAVVVGASNHVGKPIAVLLMRREATVISCNKFTPALAEITRSADVLVAAAGVPELITADMVKPGAVVVDVGVNRIVDADGRRKTVGDVQFDAASRVASYVSPVPGGVGPMTVAVLLTNVVEAAERSVR